MSAATSLVDQRRLGGGAPWLRWRFARLGLYLCQGGRVPVGLSLKWSREVEDPYPLFCRDQDGLGEGLRWWPVFFGLWRRKELGLVFLQGRAFTNRVCRRLLMLAVELVRLEWACTGAAAARAAS
jgi:hypothetical protein